jgi:hypothetical protein
METMESTLAGLQEMPLSTIAGIIFCDWSKQGKGVNYAAKPYLDAMGSLENITDKYMFDSGLSVVCYFLSNAGSWKGETAKAVKKELKRRAGIK